MMPLSHGQTLRLLWSSKSFFSLSQYLEIATLIAPPICIFMWVRQTLFQAIKHCFSGINLYATQFPLCFLHSRTISLLRHSPAPCLCSVEGGELFDRIVDENYQLTELDAIVFMRQICEGVQYLHQQYILHLDLKVKIIYRT